MKAGAAGHIVSYVDVSGLDANPSELILLDMSSPDRREVVFQATAVNNHQHHYAIQKTPDGLFYVWEDNYPSAGANKALEKLTLTADDLRAKFALGEWRLLEGSIPE
jgi:hypothetical protein